jgi:hypothetical protein
VTATRADALALGCVVLPPDLVREGLQQVREALPDDVEVWLGGPGSAAVELPEGVLRLDTLVRLEQRVELLRVAARR